MRWVTLGGFLLFFSLTLYAFLTERSTLIQQGASTTWYRHLFMFTTYIGLFKLAPVVIGVALSVFQFLPELGQKRLRLSLHLPLDPKITLLTMVLFGEAILLVGMVFLFVVLTLFMSFLMPWQLISPAILSIIPWGLAGIIGYNFMVVVLLEPVFFQRLFHGATGTVLLLFCMQKTVMEGLNPQLWWIALLTFSSLLGVLYTGNRFAKIYT